MFMLPLDADVDRFVATLHYGRQSAVTARRLRALGGWSDRTLRVLAHRATERGILICADNSGYFRPMSRAEVDETIGRLRSQGREMLDRANRIQGLADHLSLEGAPQPTFWE